MTVRKMRELLKVYFICGSQNVNRFLPDVLQEAINGGITIFQYREKGGNSLTGAEKENLGRKLREICKKANIPFIVNDDVDLALTLDADGVHIGQEDDDAKVVRRKIGNRILGISAHTVDEALQAIGDGADYIGVGPVFATTTKTDTREVCGPQFINTLRKHGIEIPIVAIGGITVGNAAEVINNHADGVAVISAISKAENPFLAAKSLKDVWGK